MCRLALWVAFFAACSASAPGRFTLPSTGGTIEITSQSGGRAFLSVGPSTSGREITATASSSNTVGLGDIYTFGPDGTVFEPSAELRVQLAPSDRIDPARAVVQTRRKGGIWEPLETTDVDEAARALTVKMHHFSEVAVFSNDTTTSGLASRFQTRDIEIESSRVVDLSVWATPNYSHLGVKVAEALTSFTLRGLLPAADYFIYTNTYGDSPLVLRSDVAGTLNFTPTAAPPYDLFVQSHHGTVVLPRDCSLVGTPTMGTSWAAEECFPLAPPCEVPTKCSLQGNILGRIDLSRTFPRAIFGIPFIAQTPAGYELDCAQHTIYGQGCIMDNGIIVAAPAASIRNCAIENVSSGIEYAITNPSGGEVSNTVIRRATYGIVSFGHQSLILRETSIGASVQDPLCFSGNLSVLNNNSNQISGWQIEGGTYEGAIHIYGNLRDSTLKPKSAIGINIVSIASDEGATGNVSIADATLKPNDHLGTQIVESGWASTVHVAQGDGEVRIHNNTFELESGGGLLLAGVTAQVRDNDFFGRGSGDDGLVVSASFATVEANIFSGLASAIRVRDGAALSARYNDFIANRVSVASPFALTLLGNYWGIACPLPAGLSFGPIAVLGAIADHGSWGVPIAQDTSGYPPVAQLRANGPPGCQNLDFDGDGFSPVQGDCNDSRRACIPGIACTDADGDGYRFCEDCDDGDSRCSTECAGRVVRHLFQQR